MKHKEIIKLSKGLPKIIGCKGIKLNYAISKNIALTQKEMDVLVEQEKGINDLTKEFNEKAQEVYIKYAKKNSAGQPDVITDPETKLTAYQFEDGVVLKSVTPAIEKLKKEYAKELEEQEKASKEYNDFLNTENDTYTPYLIDNEDDEVKTALNDMLTEHINILFPLFKTEQEEMTPEETKLEVKKTGSKSGKK